MNLWIRSQDKKLLIPISNALYIPQSRTGENFGIFYEDIMLGYYTKEERVLEVLEEIQRILMFEWDYKDRFSMTRVYTMPEE